MSETVMDIIWEGNYVGFSMVDIKRWAELSRKSNQLVCQSYLNTARPLNAAVGAWFSQAECVQLPEILNATNSLLGGSTIFGYVSGLRWEGMTLDWHTEDGSLPYVHLWLCSCGYARERDGFSIEFRDGEVTSTGYVHEPEITDMPGETDGDESDTQEGAVEREINGVSTTRWIRHGQVITVHNSEVGALGTALSQTDVLMMNFMSHTRVYCLQARWVQTQRVPIIGGYVSEIGRLAMDRGWQSVVIGPALHEGMEGKLRWLGDDRCMWIQHNKGHDGLVGGHSWADTVEDGKFAVRYLPIYTRGDYNIADISFAFPMATREGSAGMRGIPCFEKRHRDLFICADHWSESAREHAEGHVHSDFCLSGMCALAPLMGHWIDGGGDYTLGLCGENVETDYTFLG